MGQKRQTPFKRGPVSFAEVQKTMDRWVNAINLGISPGFLISDFRAVVRLDFENVSDPMCRCRNFPSISGCF
jgi:hypothetical protein